MREIILGDTLLPDGTAHPNDPVRVYDCSGPWGTLLMRNCGGGASPCVPPGYGPAGM
ncbi:MAG: hypothetical protein ACLSUW_01880 [Akkermansia sp.]